MINNEAFELIEQRKEEGVTADYLAKRLGITPRSAATWLSKWKKRGFLRYIPFGEMKSGLQRPRGLERRRILKGGKQMGTQGIYVLGEKEWASYAHGKLEERMAFREDVKKW